MALPTQTLRSCCPRCGRSPYAAPGLLQRGAAAAGCVLCDHGRAPAPGQPVFVLGRFSPAAAVARGCRSRGLNAAGRGGLSYCCSHLAVEKPLWRVGFIHFPSSPAFGCPFPCSGSPGAKPGGGARPRTGSVASCPPGRCRFVRGKILARGSGLCSPAGPRLRPGARRGVTELTGDSDVFFYHEK